MTEDILLNNFFYMDYIVRFVEETDAEFIVELRNDPKLNRHLSQTSASVEDQRNWIKSYKVKEHDLKELYFIILENDIRKGLYRLYKINDISFTIGSWLFKDCENKQLPILTDLYFCEYGFTVLNKPILLFDVRKQNRKVIQYHSLKFPLQYTECDLDNFYLLQKDKWEKSKDSVLSFFGIDKNKYQLLNDDFSSQLNSLNIL